jgi:hypothetical protein
VDQVLVAQDDLYTYERETTIDNATFKTPAITLLINKIFKGAKESFIKFEAFRPRKIHTEKERTNSACFACHMNRYSNEKMRFKVIDREDDDEEREIIYYTRVLLDHKLENQSKIFFDDEDYVFEQINSKGQDISFPGYQKYLESGQIWQITDNYSLNFKASSTDRIAWLEFLIDNEPVEQDAVQKDFVTANSVFSYEPDIRYRKYAEDNITIFSTNITSVFMGQKDFILLEDSQLLSPRIEKTISNTSIFGYNSSWLYPGYRFTIGKIPSSLHAPNLFDDRNNWADCVGCHDTSKNLRISQIDAIFSKLGKHSILNAAAPDIAYSSDPINKACLACHTGGIEPITHSPTYPRKCSSCHISGDAPTYGAANISDEPHRNQENCESCHTPQSHIIVKREMLPSISNMNISQIRVNTGDNVKLTARATAGYEMKLRSVEYFMDVKGSNGKGVSFKPDDGTFDSQKEQISVDINTTNINTGDHKIYIHAMERKNRWGEFYQVNFTVIQNGVSAEDTPRLAEPGIIYGLISIILSYLFIRKWC